MRKAQIATKTKISSLMQEVNSVVQTQTWKGAVQRQKAMQTATQA